MLTWSAHISTLFTEHPYAQRVAHARAAGFEWIESWWPDESLADALVLEVAANRMGVCTINAPSGDEAGGEHGVLNDPARRDEALTGFAQALDLAERLGASKVHVQVGRRRQHVPERIQVAAVVATLRECVTMAAAHDVTILLEPLNDRDVPGYLASSPEAVAQLIEAVGSDHIRLLFDAYHLAMSGRDPVAAVDVFGDLIGHVQFADFPGRSAPGTGTLDLWAIVDRLDAVGYASCIGLEYVPVGDTPATLSFLEQARPPAPFERPA